MPITCGRVRRVFPALLLVLAVLAGTVGAAAVLVRDTVLDGPEFADRVVAALSTAQAREVIAEQVAGQVVAGAPQTLAVRPLLELAVQGALSSGAGQDLLAAAVQDLHATVLSGRSDTLTLRLVDLVLVVKTQLAAVAPDSAARIPDDLTDAVVNLSRAVEQADAVRLADRVRAVAFLAPLLAVLLCVGALAVAPDRRRGLRQVGVAVGAVGPALLVIERAVRVLALRSVPAGPGRTVAAAIWTQLTGGVSLVAFVLVGLGAGLAALVGLAVHRLRPYDALRRLGELAVPPVEVRRRAVWAATVAVLGLVLLLDGPQLARLLLAAAGAVLLLVGLTEAVRLLLGPAGLPLPYPTDDVPAPGGSGSIRVPAARRRRLARGARIGLAGVTGVAVLAGAGTAIARSGGSAPPPGARDPRCNGSVLLCDRPLDQVALAATHNSMSAADSGFIVGNQPHGILAQLDAGYRGLLVDVYYGLRTRSSRLVVTDRTTPDASARAEQVAEVGEAAVRAAEELRRKAQVTGGRELYLCHAACEIGALPLASQLDAVRAWLDAHPREVLVVIVQDAAAPADVVRAFRAAGLAGDAYTHRPGTRWPTLQQMITSGRRLLVMAERQGGAAPWYQQAFELTQETPYSFGSVAEFSCAPNRGRPDSPLFLVNHFVTPSSVTAATQANSLSVLTDRLQQCAQQRHHVPNLVAVDFYNRGDPLLAVDRFNGVPPRAPGRPVR